MSHPFIPHVTKIAVSVAIEGHQMESVSRTVLFDVETSGKEVMTQTADALLSVIDLAIAKVPHE